MSDNPCHGQNYIGQLKVTGHLLYHKYVGLFQSIFWQRNNYDIKFNWMLVKAVDAQPIY